MIWEGISDLTSTEGNLKNFTRICEIVGDRPIEKNTLVGQIQANTEIKRTSEKVIERHLSIMSKLSIVSEEPELLRLSPYGKILLHSAKEQSNSNGEFLNDHEKLFFFTNLFSGKALPQLALLLLTIENKDAATKGDLVYAYYKNYLKTHLQIWNRETLERRLHEYETTRKIARAEVNRFDCMVQWLENLGLISGNELTKSGSIFLRLQPSPNIQADAWFDYQQRITNEIFFLAASSLWQKDFRRFELQSDSDNALFLGYIRDALHQFGNKSSRTVSSIYFNHWVPSELLLHNRIYCSKKDLDELLDRFYNNKVIISVMAGDYKKEEKLFKMGEDNF
jgi:hypothetical protein